MSANNYTIAISPLTGKIYVVKTSKLTSSSDKHELAPSEFMPVFVGWLKNEIGNNDVFNISENGTPIFQIKRLNEPKVESEFYR